MNSHPEDTSPRVLNFNAGPSTIPIPVLNQVANEITNWKKSGMSVMEVSHRGSEWKPEIPETLSRMKRLLEIPDDFEIIMVSGGASLQFSAIPFNLLGNYKKVDYLVTGLWGKQAYNECVSLDFPGVEVNLVVGLPSQVQTSIPDRSTWKVGEDSAYFHLTDNETAGGIQFNNFPEVSSPLVVDMSSSIFSKKIGDWKKIGCIYFCSQKNLTIPGVTTVIVRKDLLSRPLKKHCPKTLDFRLQVKSNSAFNTPPTFNIYMCNLMMKWYEEVGLEKIWEKNKEKARLLYSAIDKSEQFFAPVECEFRSQMNVVFFRKDGLKNIDPKKDKIFEDYCKMKNIVGILGHRTMGGFRASIYNAVPVEWVISLAKAIEEFSGFEPKI